MRERSVRPVRPPELTAFRLSDWLNHRVLDHRVDERTEREVHQRVDEQHGDAEREQCADEDRALTVVAVAYDRYRAARKAWVEAHNGSPLDDLIECRRRRPGGWVAAQAEAAAIGGAL